jgi:hypothetical protein
MFNFCTESIGFAEYLIMYQSDVLKYLLYDPEERCFRFESEETWANKYDLSKEKQHDQIVMRLRNLKR